MIFSKSTIIFYLLLAQVSIGLGQKQVAQTIYGEYAQDRLGFSFDLNKSGSRIVVGGAENDEVVSHSGHIRIFDLIDNQWVQIGKDIDGVGQDNLGYAVSFSGDGSFFAASSTAYDNGQQIDAGKIEFFQFVDNSWQKIRTPIFGQYEQEYFGTTLELSESGNRIIIGTGVNGFQRGLVRVYEWDGLVWNQIGRTFQGRDNDSLGGIVKISSDGKRIAFAGSRVDDNGTDSGQVQVYEYDGIDWAPVGSFINGDSAGDNFGSSVSFINHGNMIAVGATGDEERGSVSIFEFDGDSWIQKGDKIVPDANEKSFGIQNALIRNGNSIIVSGLSNDERGSEFGLVSFFDYSNGTWNKSSNTIVGANRGDWFGYYFALSERNDLLAIGAPFDSEFQTNAGQVSVFETEVNSLLTSGIVYEDVNENAQRDPDEAGIPNVAIRISNDDEESITYTNSDGVYEVYSFDLNLMEQSITAIANECWEPTSSTTLNNFEEGNADFGYKRIGEEMSQKGRISSGAARCNFEVPFWISTINTGCTSQEVEFKIEFPDELELLEVPVNFVLDPDKNIISSTFYSEYTQSETFRCLVKMPSEDFTNYYFEVISKAIVDGDIVDEYVYPFVLLCAIDPNDKLVSPNRFDDNESNYTQLDEPLEYTVRFQNVGNDTAFNVRIEDRLDENFDLTSLEILASSHDHRTVLNDDRKLIFYFDDILLPDSTTNEVESHGFVKFSLKLNDHLADFSLVKNTADIYFDFNRPIITNTQKSTIVHNLDEDKDGYFFWQDCDDQNAELSVIAEEIPNNGIDEDCDGEDLVEESLSLESTVILDAKWREELPYISWRLLSSFVSGDIMVLQRLNSETGDWDTIEYLEEDKLSGYHIDKEYPTEYIDLYYRVHSFEEGSSSSVVSLKNTSHNQEESYISPNPTLDGSFILTLNSDILESLEYSIMNVSGQKVQKGTLQLIQGLNKIHFNLQSNISGVYYLKIESGTGPKILRVVAN